MRSPTGHTIVYRQQHTPEHPYRQSKQGGRPSAGSMASAHHSVISDDIWLHFQLLQKVNCKWPADSANAAAVEDAVDLETTLLKKNGWLEHHGTPPASASSASLGCFHSMTAPPEFSSTASPESRTNVPRPLPRTCSFRSSEWRCKAGRPRFKSWRQLLAPMSEVQRANL